MTLNKIPKPIDDLYCCTMTFPQNSNFNTFRESYNADWLRLPESTDEDFMKGMCNGFLEQCENYFIREGSLPKVAVVESWESVRVLYVGIEK